MLHVTSEALILAGGLGTRLRSVIADRPKPMADVAGRPFLAHLLEQLSRHGFRRAIICVGYNADHIRARLGDSFGPLTLAYSTEDRPLGTAGALRLAADMIESANVLAMNGDSFCDLDLVAFGQAHGSYPAAATLAVLQQQDRSRSGAVTIDSTGKILKFESRPTVASAGLVSAGVYMFRREAIREIAFDRKVSLEEEIFPLWVERGRLFGWRVEGRFIDIGTPESYDAAQHFFIEL
jgi:D-glycero-alpha-D-manno-heptose 1-phosphate guanylyltransferase